VKAAELILAESGTCTVVSLDSGRPGTPPLWTCGSPVAAVVTLGCEHEHIDADGQCAYHADRAGEGNYICLRCWDTGHRCLESVIRIEWAGQDG
jgi:hypothetical protein